MLKKNGFKYIENNKENIISFINDIEKIIDKNFDPKKNLNNLSFDNFNKLVFKTQNEINRKHHPINFAKRFPDIFKKELSSDKFYFQHYYYLMFKFLNCCSSKVTLILIASTESIKLITLSVMSSLGTHKVRSSSTLKSLNLFKSLFL